MIELVSCTQRSWDDFWNRSALGISLNRIGNDPRVRVGIVASNALGLPQVYNGRIDADNDAELLIFIHDDVWLDDYFFFDRVVEGLCCYDIIGIAGSDDRLPRQPSWAFESPTSSGELKWKASEALSGAVAHGENPFGNISRYGASPRPVTTLDGVLLACRKSALRDKSVHFDERFRFHFYDLDFCRTAVAAGLKLGTWPIAVTHQSGGRMGTPEWMEQYRRYLEKWGD